jgi:hypothetical protein
MFHWICPECGREIPPAVKECTACDPHAAVLPAPAASTALAVPAELASSPGAATPLPTVAALREMPPPPHAPLGSAAGLLGAGLSAASSAPEARGAGVAVLEAPPEVEELEVEELLEGEPLPTEYLVTDPVAASGLPPALPPPLPELDAPERAPAEESLSDQVLAEPALPEAALHLLAMVLTPLPLSLPAPESAVSTPILPLQTLPAPVVPADLDSGIIPCEPPPLPELAALAEAVQPDEHLITRAEIGPSETKLVETVLAAPKLAAPKLAESPLAEPVLTEPALVEPLLAESPLTEAQFSLKPGPLAVESVAAVETEIPPTPPTLTEPAPLTSFIPFRMPRGPFSNQPALTATARTNSESGPLAPLAKPPVKSLAKSRVAVVESIPAPRPATRQEPLRNASVVNAARSNATPPDPGQPPSPDNPARPISLTPLQAISTTVRPSSPRPLAAPAMAELIDYSAAALRRLRPAIPPQQMFVPVAQPRITLPGPALPRELHSLAGAGLSTVLERPRGARRRRPGMGLMLLGLLAVVLCLGAVLLVVPPLLSNGKSSAVQTADSSSVPATGNIHPISNTYSLSKTIEVSGFRFVVDLNNKSEIHYLVVNHSPAQFGGVTVFVTLRSADAKPGQPPVAHFSFRAPDLEPYGSREMTSPIQKVSRPVTLPDWQDLRAEVEIAQ